MVDKWEQHPLDQVLHDSILLSNLDCVAIRSLYLLIRQVDVECRIRQQACPTISLRAR